MENNKNILPTQEVQDELWERIAADSDKVRRRKTNYRRSAAAIAAVLVVCLAIPQTGFAAEIKALFGNFFAGDSATEQAVEDMAVQDVVYSDSDGHVTLEIPSVMSDGICSYVTLHYTALDSEGGDWLANGEAFYDDNMSGLESFNIIGAESTEEYAATGSTAGWSAGFIEDEDKRTDTERWFTAELFESDSSTAATEQPITLTYSMTGDEVKTGRFEIPVGSEWRECELTAAENLSDAFTIEHIDYTDMSFKILGQNISNYEVTRNEDEYSIAVTDVDKAEADAAKLDNIIFRTADGEEIQTMTMYALGATPDDEYTIYAADGVYLKDGEKTVVDSSEFVEMEIAGIVYKLK